MKMSGVQEVKGRWKCEVEEQQWEREFIFE